RRLAVAVAAHRGDALAAGIRVHARDRRAQVLRAQLRVGRIDAERAVRPAHARQLHERADLVLGRALEDRRLRLEAELATRPAERGLQDLADVHAAGHAQRVQADVHRRAVRQERHVLLRHDAGDDALVAVPAGHLVADADLALLGDVDLHELHHAGRQLVRLEDLVDLLLGTRAHLLDAGLRLGDDTPDALVRVLVLHLERG